MSHKGRRQTALFAFPNAFLRVTKIVVKRRAAEISLQVQENKPEINLRKVSGLPL